MIGISVISLFVLLPPYLLATQVVVSSDSGASAYCVVCERIALFQQSKELVSRSIWQGLSTTTGTVPLVYFSDSSSYVAFAPDSLFAKYPSQRIFCTNGLVLLKLSRLDTQPFHMENKMNFKDSSSLYYQRAIMQCSDVEGMIKLVPDFTKTEDWLQLVMHEYFHSFQFSHPATMQYLARTIAMSADTMDAIYMANDWFRQALVQENTALLHAIASTAQDTRKEYIAEFIRLREERCEQFQQQYGWDIRPLENFYESIEGTARYVEYYLAGNFQHIPAQTLPSCDSLFRGFQEYTGQQNFEDKAVFKERTKMMRAYYYVTGFNLCRLMDAMGISYKPDLFNHPTTGLYAIFLQHARP